MARSMALIENGTVANMLWCSDGEPESDTLKNPEGRPVGIGDTYEDGKWFREGVEILTPLEQAQAESSTLQRQLSELDSAYTEGVNSL